LKNRAALANQGIVVPSPTRYRKLLRDTATQLKGATASYDTQAMILDQIMEEPTAQRLILSWDGFLGFPAWAVREVIYSFAGEHILAFTQIFPEIDAEFHLAIRNPATFLPSLQEKVTAKGQEYFLSSLNPTALHWSDTITQIRARNPNAPLTVWCDEDTPLIWPEVLREVAGHSDDLVLADTDDLLARIMTPDGFARMNAYLAAHPPVSITQRRRIATAFLEKFARPDQIDMEFSVPGWTEDLVTEITALYYEDVERIKAMPGVRFLTA
jgi:hypothetical protein